MRDCKKKHPAGRVLKAILIAILALLLAVILIAVAGYVISRKNDAPAPTEPVLTNTPEEYIDTPVYDEPGLVGTATEKIPVRLSEETCAELLSMVKTPDSVFRLAEYYGLEQAYALYRSADVQKSTENNLLTDGKLDAGKLYQTVLRNNAAATEKGRNTLNPLYVELEDEKIREICGTITEVGNRCTAGTDMEKLANTLERLTVFKRHGGAASAYVSTEIAFVYIPAVVDIYKHQQEITGDYADSTEEQVMIHETLHLIQFASNDGNDENGIEVGFLRKFNPTNGENVIPVDALYTSWIAEAGAELAMAEYLGVEPGTYQKKISYAASCNLSRFYDWKSEQERIEWLSFAHSFDEVFETLGLETEEEQLEYLKLLFSIEITQTDAVEFLEYYDALTGHSLTEQEQTELRMDVRTDAVEYLTRSFFDNLIRAIHDGAVSDLDTVFYLLRLWELDTFNHLRYTEKNGLERAKDFLLRYDGMQTALLTAVAESSALEPDQMQDLYEAYAMQAETAGGKTVSLCDLTELSPDMQAFIAQRVQGYTAKNFSRIRDVAQWLSQTVP